MIAMISGSCEASGEQLNTGDQDPSFGADDRCLKVLCEATIAAEPGEGALDHPASGFWLEGSEGLSSGDDFDRPLAQIGKRIEQLLSAIDAIGEDMPQPGKPAANQSQQRHGTMIVLNIGRVHENGEQRTFGISDDVTLASHHPLGSVEPAWAAAFRGLHALAVDDGGR